MEPDAASTTMPSGVPRRPVTSVFTWEPSVCADTTRPPRASRKYNRGAAVATTCADSIAAVSEAARTAVKVRMTSLSACFRRIHSLARSWRAGLAGRFGPCAEAPACAHALPEFLAFFRRHLLATLRHAPARSTAVHSKSAEEDPAERKESDRLPEGNLPPPDDRRHQPVPQQLHHRAAEGDKDREADNRQRRQQKQFLSPRHDPVLTCVPVRRRCSAAARAGAAPHSVSATAGCSRWRLFPRPVP